MRLKIEKLDHQGRGIAHSDDKIVFVENALPDEIVEVQIVDETSKYKVAIVTDYIEKSSARNKSKCPYYEECGGCHLRHLSYDDTIAFKKNKLTEILQKYAGLTPNIEVVKNKNKDFYRNKVELHISNGVAGFYKKHSHDIVELDRCLNVEDAINTILRSLDFFHLSEALMIIKCNYNGEIIIAIESHEEPHIDVEILREKVKLVGIIYNGETYFGADHYIEMAGGLLFKETYNSFFQVNRYMTEQLFAIVKSFLKPNSTVLDMCCGVGTLSLLAARVVKKVYGIEIVENAIKDAIINARMNKIENVEFMLGDAFENAGKIVDSIDTIVVDPPRSGLSPEGINNILTITPQSIIYISCDPVTLSRDLKILSTQYDVKKVYLLDMFSYTYHLENICILERKNHIEIC